MTSVRCSSCCGNGLRRRIRQLPQPILLLWRFSADHRFSDWHRTLHGSRCIQPVGWHYGIHRYRRQRLRSFHICITFNPLLRSPVTATAGTITCAGTTNVTVSATGGTPFFNCWGYSLQRNRHHPTACRYPFLHGHRLAYCTASASVTITQPDPIVVNCTVTEPIVMARTEPYSSRATGTVGATTGTGTFSVPAGEYYIFNVTDANGCIYGCTGQISQPAKVEALSTFLHLRIVEVRPVLLR